MILNGFGLSLSLLDIFRHRVRLKCCVLHRRWSCCLILILKLFSFHVHAEWLLVRCSTLAVDSSAVSELLRGICIVLRCDVLFEKLDSV